MKPKITPNCNRENDTGDNIDKVLFFSRINKRDNTDGNDGTDNVEDNEFYI